MGFFATVRSFDFYRKIPRDLTEGSLSGALLSLGAAISISLLLGYEFRAYLEPSSTTDVLVDKSLNGEVVPINFKISFPSLPCEWADFDLSNTLGTHFINDDGISSMGVKTMRKFPIDSALREVPSVYQDKPEPIFDENDPGVKAHEARVLKGEHPEDDHLLELDDRSIDITPATFDKEVKAAPVVMVAFMAPWCPWCQKLAPVWEHFAGEVKRTYGNEHIHIGTVNCVTYQALCYQHKITGYPTIRIFRDGSDVESQTPFGYTHSRYTGDRTTPALMKFAEGLLPAEVVKAAKNMPGSVGDRFHLTRTAEAARNLEVRGEDHYGCQIEGFVMVKKVPGTIVIGAESQSHSFDHSMMNVSHVIHHFSFGHRLSIDDEKVVDRVLRTPTGQKWHSFARTAHFKATPYLAYFFNVTFEHYMDVVLTTVETDDFAIDVYEYTVHSHHYQSSDRPHARFSYDPSPMQVVVSEHRKPFLHFVTNLCAIIGGVFTVVGLIDAIFYNTGKVVFKRSINKLG